MLLASLLDEMQVDRMTDRGMYAWAVVVAVLGLAASYGIVLLWQRFRDGRRSRDDGAP